MSELPVVEAVLDADDNLKFAAELRKEGLPRGEVLARLMDERGLSEDAAFEVVSKLPDRPEDKRPEPEPERPKNPEVARARALGVRNRTVGGIVLAGGAAFTAASYSVADQFDGTFLVARGAIVLGFIGLLGGFIQFIKGSE